MQWMNHFAGKIEACAAAVLFLVATLAVGAQTVPTKAPIAKRGAPRNETDWWKNAVIYEVYPRSFQDTNGDGIGDLNGITSRLDYLKDLGVDAIWLTPVYPSPQVDFGYDISDYRNIDPQYGTLADFDRLVAEARKRNIRVMMDMVMNHTSDQHQWFLQSRSSRDNPYRDLVRVARRQGRNGDRSGPAAEQLAIVFRSLSLAVGRENAPVLLPQVLHSAARPELEQSQGA